MNAPLPIFSAFVDGKDSESSGSSFELINPQDGSIIGPLIRRLLAICRESPGSSFDGAIDAGCTGLGNAGLR